MNSRVVHVLLSSIVTLLFSVTLILASIAFQMTPSDSPNPIPGLLALAGLVVALVGMALGLAAFVGMAEPGR